MNTHDDIPEKLFSLSSCLQFQCVEWSCLLLLQQRQASMSSRFGFGWCILKNNRAFGYFTEFVVLFRTCMSCTGKKKWIFLIFNDKNSTLVLNVTIFLLVTCVTTFLPLLLQSKSVQNRNSQARKYQDYCTVYSLLQGNFPLYLNNEL